MRSLFELISKYKSDLVIVPIIAFAALIVTLLIYLFLNKNKIIKYIPGFIAVIVGILFLILGFTKLLTISGLDFVETSAKVFTVIFFSIILDILDSFFRGIRGKSKTKDTENKRDKKSRVKNLDNIEKVEKAEKTK